MRLFSQVMLVAVGSALGGLARWGIGAAFFYYWKTKFPWATFLINVSGSLFLGWFMTMLANRFPNGAQNTWVRPDDLRLLVAIGFTGAYTTFSTFEWETHQLFKADFNVLGAAYVAASVFVGLLAVHLGVYLARWV